MNLSIDLSCCTRCGLCAEFCPGHVLALDRDGQPFERYPEDCWYCGVCQVECPAECITVVFPYLIR
jgi:NAD-dependent dihydropyrimidine dehydrogenase PreA subunit